MLKFKSCEKKSEAYDRHANAATNARSHRLTPLQSEARGRGREYIRFVKQSRDQLPLTLVASNSHTMTNQFKNKLDQRLNQKFFISKLI